MFKWIKEILFGSGDFIGNGSFPPVRTPPMPKVKPTKGSNIMETKEEDIVNFIKFLEEKNIHLMDTSGRYDRYICGASVSSDFTEVITLIEEWNKNK